MKCSCCNIQISQTGHMVLAYGHTRAALNSSSHQRTSCLSYDSTRNFIFITHIIKTVRNCNLHLNYCSVEEVMQKLDPSPCLLSIRWQLFPFYGINGPQNEWKLFQNSRLRSPVWLSMTHVPISKGRDGCSYSNAQNNVPAPERLLRATCTVHLKTAVRTLWRCDVLKAQT